MNAFVHRTDYFLRSVFLYPFSFSFFLLFLSLISPFPFYFFFFFRSIRKNSLLLRLFIAFVVGENKAYIYSVIKRASSVSGYEKKKKKSGIKYFVLRRA